MSDLKPQLCCPNPNCVAPLNSLGSLTCASCETTLVYRYVWAVGKAAEAILPNTQVAGRYYVTAPQVWLDTQPSVAPDVPAEWIDAVMPYLHLYPCRLHVPEVNGFCPEADGIEAGTIILLENVPIDAKGLLYPAIAQVWAQASAVRQVYWLWQLLELWTPLQAQGVTASLLAANNLRVEGWRVRLCQFYHDADVLPTTGDASTPLGLVDLANLWLNWAETARAEVQAPLQAICRHMQSEGVTLAAIAAQLNQLLLGQAALLPLRLQVAGATDTGPQRSHNEDTCYPVTLRQPPLADALLPRLAIVCDGIGGHEGGEVASQTAVRSLKLQIQALLAEVAEQTELVPPTLLAQQLEAIVRVTNNLIASQNDTQGREDRRRMGTTLMMAIQVPQAVTADNGTIATNGHELYLVSVGDSRAYWITQRYCHRLTVDDDVAAREVRMGRALYWEALKRPDAGSLTQAIGTRDAEFLHPTIQRFILEEDGVLLLCSDGLSDRDLVEAGWAEYTEPVLKGKQTLDEAVQAWIDRANERNGHDNTSVVLLHCHVSSTMPEISLPGTSRRSAESTWSPASKALMDEWRSRRSAQASTTKTRRTRSLANRWVTIGIAMFIAGGLTLLAWSLLVPGSFQPVREQLQPKPQ